MNKKRLYALLVVSFLTANVFAQEVYKGKEEEPEEEGLFKKRNLFAGGTLNVSFFNGTTQLGISPYFGYSINKFVDVAASMNVNYISQRDYSNYGDKLRQTIFGPGAFVRLYPVKFLFAHAQYDYNFIRYKYIPVSNSGLPPEKFNFRVPSFLVGGGFAQGRGEGSNTFYYISILWDVAKNINSPYVDYQGRAVPQIRAGFNISLSEKLF